MVSFIVAFDVFSSILGLSLFKEASARKQNVLQGLFIVNLIVQTLLVCFVSAQVYYLLKGDVFTFTGLLIETQSVMRAVMGIVVATACYWNEKNLANLYHSIQSELRTNASVNTEVCDKIMVRQFVVNLVIVLLLVIASCCTEARGYLTSDGQSLGGLALENDYLKDNPGILAFILVTWMVYHRLYFALFAITFSSLCQLLKMSYAQYNANLKSEVSTNPQFFEDKVAHFRRQFSAMSKYVDQISSVFKTFLATWIAYCTLSVFIYEKCLQKSDGAPHFARLLHFGFLILNELYVLHIIYKEAYLLGAEARKSSEYLTDSVSEDTYKSAPNSHLLLFSQRVSQSDIGISVGNYAVIDRNFILMTLGVILTYTIFFLSLY